MIGWHISIYRQASGATGPATVNTPTGNRLAILQFGPDGLAWLVDLVQAGKAIELGGDGYPFRYTAMAEAVLPNLVDKPQPGQDPRSLGWKVLRTGQWEGRAELDHSVIADCCANEWVIIEAWDES